MSSSNIKSRACSVLMIVLLVITVIIYSSNDAFAKKSKIVYDGAPFYKWGKGYASFNLPNGVNMPRGGSVYWSDNGGPSVSVSVGGGYGAFSVSLGVASSSKTNGVSVKVPANKHYYKVYVEKQYKVRKYKVYVWKYSPKAKKETWVLSSRGVEKKLNACKYYAKKVCPNRAHKCG